MKLSLLAALAALFVFGISHQAPVQADAGCVTAKTWIDPANGHSAYGDGSHDDWQNLEDMLNYAFAHNDAVKLEGGNYRITKTLVLALAHPSDQLTGFRISGINGPQANGQTNGVSLVLDSQSATQPAVLEIGQGAFYQTIIENIGLKSAVPNFGTKYGLLFAEQEFSNCSVRNTNVQNVGTAFAIVAGTTGGGNGEDVTLDHCDGGGNKGYYFNNCGQALYHHIINCQAGGNNGATAIEVGSGNLGFDLDITGFSYTFGTGPLQNTFVQNDGVSGCVNIKGGRLEWCDTLLTYSGGSTNLTGSVEMRGIDVSAMNLYVSNNQWVAKTFPLVDDTLLGTRIQNTGQYTNTFSNCLISGSSGPVYPALSLTSVTGDYCKNYFEKCVFRGFSNKLTDTSGTPSVFWTSGSSSTPVSNQAALTAIGGIIRDCRTTTGPTYAGSVLVNMP